LLFYAILGGNGAGKSTTLKVISGLRSAYRGDVRLQGKLGHLPQNPQTLFVKRTVREDLYEVAYGGLQRQLVRWSTAAVR